MRKLNLFLIMGILFISFAVGKIVAESHNFAISGTGGISANITSGARIYAKENASIYAITFDPSMTGDVVKVLNETGGFAGTVDKILNESLISNKIAQINVSLVAGQYYTISVTNRSGAWTELAYVAGGASFPLAGNSINWTNGSRLNATDPSIRNIQGIYLADNIYSLNQTLFNTTAVETDSESFITNITSSSAVSSALLFYNFTSYSTTVSSLGGNVYRITKNLVLPLITPSSYINPIFWNITFANGTNVLTNPVFQTTSQMNLSICGASPQDLLYYNITFKNETTAQERVNAVVTSSTWNYWLGDGSVNRTLTYSNASLTREYNFCFTPKDRSVNTALTFSYDNSESEQRNYNPSTFLLSNTSTSTTLFLLPSTQGQYVTFQVINGAEQALSGVLVTASRSGIGVIETGTTDASGTVTFFLNPSFAYTLLFSKAGFSDFTTTITPSQTSYTITMGGTSGSTNTTNSASGMSFVILPSQRTLNNGTTYNFNLTLNSSFWSLDSWGFTLQNRSGFVFASQSSTTSNGGFLSSNLNTVENKTIVMNYFWVINGVYNNATITWGIVDLSGNTLSITQFFTDLRSYVSLGFFGLDDVGLGIITFFAIFLVTGVMSYKFGVSSPAAIIGLMFSLVMFFDIGLGLIPNPIGAVPHAPTFFMFILLVGSIFRELGR